MFLNAVKVSKSLNQTSRDVFCGVFCLYTRCSNCSNKSNPKYLSSFTCRWRSDNCINNNIYGYQRLLRRCYVRSIGAHLPEGPSLRDFINAEKSAFDNDLTVDEDHYIHLDYSNQRSVYVETYGCQMNVNDTEIALGLLAKSGYIQTKHLKKADVILLMTCAIRDGAEQKIWARLRQLRGLKRKDALVGLLGCMAERLKHKIVEEDKIVDVVCGPDAYRDLPRLLSHLEPGQKGVNVQLSLEETYADVTPVRVKAESRTAFVSIMRGCDNMCSYCIVPFTRGRERSRPIESILNEVRHLSDQGVKEMTLLGQNVNSYRDLSESTTLPLPSEPVTLSPGFSTVYKVKVGGRRFSHLLDKVSLIDREMRVRFTSPHPKDFPDEVLELIKERPNICRQLHLPAQSGSSRVLEAMRRGYSREVYLDLVDRVRSILPGVAVTSDFIAGFCGESEADHEQTLSLMRHVKFSFAFCFAYSMREKTRAFHRLTDDVPQEVKLRRVDELVTSFREELTNLHRGQVGETQLVLIEGLSKRSSHFVAGRNDANTKVILPSHINDSQIKPGDYVAVKITDYTSQVLKGIPLYYTSLTDFHNDVMCSDVML